MAGKVSKISGAGGAVGYERDGEQVFVHVDRVAAIDAIGDADEQWAAVQSAKQDPTDPAQERSEVDQQTSEFNDNRDAGDRQQQRDDQGAN